MASKNDKFTFEQNIVLTNEELVSNISKFTSFISSYEGTEWYDARAKASKLFKEKKAIEYIEEVRSAVSENDTPIIKPPVSAPPKVSKPINQKTIYEKNYDKLMAIAPGLEEKMVNFKDDFFYGKSAKTGYMDFNLELLDYDSKGFYIAISHYYQVNGDMVADPDMEIFVSVKKQTIEALHYQDAMRYIEVYPDKRNRDLFSKHERKSQNDFLADWLKNIKNQGHKIKWDEGDTTGVPPTPLPNIPPSIVVDKFKKKDGEEKTVKQSEEKAVQNQESETASKSEVAEAPIISLHKTNKAELEKSMRKFLTIVAFRENGVHIHDTEDLTDRVNHILEHQGATDYIIKAWEDLQQEDHSRLKALNYYRFHSVFSEILMMLNGDTETRRIISEKSTESFRVVLGDNRNKKAPILGIYHLNGKVPEPTLLVRLDESKHELTADMLVNGFFDLPTFNAGEEFKTDLEPYMSSIGLEKWLLFLLANEFHSLKVDIKKVEDETIIAEDSTEPIEIDEEEEIDNHYINKDIPDFEVGHVELTEAHIKRGVTQKVIDYINKNQRGVVLFPRTKTMIHNTKDKLADLAHQAQMPGFRLSKTGKFYYEGRSNRADRTRSGY